MDPTGEARGEMVHRLEIVGRAGSDAGLIVLEAEHVADRVPAAR